MTVERSFRLEAHEGLGSRPRPELIGPVLSELRGTILDSVRMGFLHSSRARGRVPTQLQAAADALLRRAAAHLGWSGRALHRVLKVARTLADLAGADRVARPHIADQWTVGGIAASSRVGASDFTLSLSNSSGSRRGGIGPEWVSDATGSVLANGWQKDEFHTDNPRLNGTLHREWADGRVLNLNLVGVAELTRRAAPGEPPGSRVWMTSIPSERRCSTNRRACVVLPAPSPPSNVMNLPRCTRAQWRARRDRQALTA